MILNYLKVGIRSFLKYKTYSAISILSFSIGLVCTSLIGVFIIHETGYESGNPNINRTYRVVMSKSTGDITKSIASIPYAAAPFLKEDFKEIESIARVYPKKNVILSFGDKSFTEQQFYFSDSTIFQVLGGKILKGSPTKALSQSGSIVLSSNMASKYFGHIDPIGETLELYLAGFTVNFEITGIMENPPQNSHFKPEFLAYLDDLFQFTEVPNYVRGWYEESFWTYIVLKPGIDSRQVKDRLPGFLTNHYPPDQVKEAVTYDLQPVKEIHLHSQLSNEIEVNGSIDYLYILSIVALLVLLVACFNFVNLATARSLQRSKEIGIRKTIGGLRHHIIIQFLSETLMLTFLAAVLAIIFVILIWPYFISLTGVNLSIKELQEPVFVIFGCWILLSTGLGSGIYPALYLSSFNPVSVLKSRTASEKGNTQVVRKGLVVLQFTISIILITGTLLISRQLDYINHKNLGFGKELILTLNVRWNTELQHNFTEFKQQLLSNPKISHVTAGSWPGMGYDNYPFRPKGDDSRKMIMPAMSFDPSYLEAYNLELVAGRNFVEGAANRRSTYFMLNETAVKQLGWTPEEAIGQEIDFGYFWYYHGTVAGVIKDFNFAPLTQKIEPLIAWQSSTDRIGRLSVKVEAVDLSQTIAYIEDNWKKLESKVPFSYDFLDQHIAEVYHSEQKFTDVIKVFSGVAIGLACMGLLGIAAFATRQRAREISIRKVLGATYGSLVQLTSWEFLKLVLLANLIAIPMAYVLYKAWLQNFAYQTSIGASVFIISGVATLVLAWLTISGQCLKAAGANPVEVLRE